MHSTRARSGRVHGVVHGAAHGVAIAVAAGDPVVRELVLLGRAAAVPRVARHPHPQRHADGRL